MTLLRGICAGLGIALLLSAALIVGSLRLDHALVTYELMTAEEFDDLGRDKPISADPAFRQKVEADLPQADGAIPERAVALMHWWTNQVDHAQSGVRGTALELLGKVARGSGLTCGGMSTVFKEVLSVDGLRSRRVQLIRSLFSTYDTHVTVEVMIDGRWAIFDPTYNISFERDGRLLGVADIRQSLLNNTHGQINLIHYPQTRYPVTLEDYRIHWLPVFNNVMMMTKHRLPWYLRMPPWRYWTGPRLYILEDERSSGLYDVAGHNRLYFISSVVLPLGGLLALLLAAFLPAAARALGRPKS